MEDILLKIKNSKWNKSSNYGIFGGYNQEYISDKGDKLIFSTCSTVRTKFISNGVTTSIYGDVENEVYKLVWK